jgi:hypothetical protein
VKQNKTHTQTKDKPGNLHHLDNIKIQLDNDDDDHENTGSNTTTTTTK